jgi:hypothetical protein
MLRARTPWQALNLALEWGGSRRGNCAGQGPTAGRSADIRRDGKLARIVNLVSWLSPLGPHRCPGNASEVTGLAVGVVRSPEVTPLCRHWGRRCCQEPQLLSISHPSANDPKKLQTVLPSSTLCKSIERRKVHIRSRLMGSRDLLSAILQLFSRGLNGFPELLNFSRSMS